MSAKLDQSLDEITGARRANTRNNRTRGRGGKPVVAGGVSKRTATKPTKAAPTPTGPAVQTRGDSKIIVSNLPDDVNEQQIKEYFASTVGSVRKVTLSYTKNGKSTGIANIIFSQPGSAAEAAKAYNGVKVDGKPMKIEVVLGAQYVAAPPAPKTLSDRISAPKNAAAKPRPAKAGGKATPAGGAAQAARGTAAAGRGGNTRGRGGKRAAPRAKKTAEQLDADMADYFDATAANGAAAPATDGTAAAAPVAAPNGGEAAMEDEIM